MRTRGRQTRTRPTPACGRCAVASVEAWLTGSGLWQMAWSWTHGRGIRLGRLVPFRCRSGAGSRRLASRSALHRRLNQSPASPAAPRNTAEAMHCANVAGWSNVWPASHRTRAISTHQTVRETARRTRPGLVTGQLPPRRPPRSTVAGWGASVDHRLGHAARWTREGVSWMRVRCAASVTATRFSSLAWAAGWEITTPTADNRSVVVTSPPSETASRWYRRVRKLCHSAAAARANHAAADGAATTPAARLPGAAAATTAMPRTSAGFAGDMCARTGPRRRGRREQGDPARSGFRAVHGPCVPLCGSTTSPWPEGPRWARRGRARPGE